MCEEFLYIVILQYYNAIHPNLYFTTLNNFVTTILNLSTFANNAKSY